MLAKRTPLASYRMAIIVVCTKCRKSFQVSDQFAGKAGPCPNCKNIIRVPKLDEQVQVHVPEEFGDSGRDQKGRLIGKPLERATTQINPVVATTIGAVSLVTLFIAWVGGRMGLFQGFKISAVALLLISPPLVIAAYSILRDDELEPYRGKSLCVRSMICALAYAGLWGVFTLLAVRGMITGDLWVWFFAIPPFVFVGGMIAVATLDLGLGDGVFHCGFYVLATVILRWIAGIPWFWNQP